MALVTWDKLMEHRTRDDLWLAIDGKAYDVTSWSRLHPGGALVLMHLAGKDATQQFHACHPPHIKDLLPRFYKGTMAPSTASNISSKESEILAELQAQVDAKGLMNPRCRPYMQLAAFLALLYLSAALLAMKGYVASSAVSLALFWQQTAFIGHDLGHNAVTQNRELDNLLGLFVNAGVGIGMSWWKSTHNVHHMVVNTADSDPDIQFMPLLAVSDHFFHGLWSTYHQDNLIFDRLARRLISWQHFTFLPLLMVAKFGLYIQTVKHLVHGKAYIGRRWEAGAQLLFFCWYTAFVRCFSGWENRLAFVLLSHAAFSILHLQVRGTMNWSCPAWLDWFHGGLQFQIEHHLFPRMPRWELRRASALVQPACTRMGLKYHSPTFVEAILETLSSLRTVAKQAQEARLPDSSKLCSGHNLVSRAFR